MAYEFKPYRSVYRDPQSVKVSEVLRDRYVQNFASDSMLDKSLNEMLVAAEFAGDVERADELKSKLRNSAALRSERGDFENLGMAINMDVRDFGRGYEPLRQNYEAREKDKQAKRALVEAGQLTNEQYNDWEKRSLMRTNQETGDYEGYRGASFDENGNVDRESLYQPVTVAQNVNVDKEILNALQALEGERSGGVVTKVPSIRGIDTNGDGIVDSYYEFMVTTKTGETYKIDEERVKSVTREVLNRGDVRAYMEQDADFHTFDMLEEDLDALIGARKAALEQKLQGNLTNAERAEALQAISRLESALNGTTGQKREAARAAKLDSEKERLTNMAVDAKAVNYTVGGAYEMDYSAREQENWRRNAQTHNQPPPGLPSTPGQPQTHQSAVRPPNNGDVSVQSVVDHMESLFEAQNIASAMVLDNYSYLLPAGPASLESTADWLDATGMEQIRQGLLDNAENGMVTMPDGTQQSVEVALAAIETRKQTVEHYRRLEQASADMIDLANNTAQTNAEDLAVFIQDQGYLVAGSATPGTYNSDALNYAGGMIAAIRAEFDTQGAYAPGLGNIVDYVHTAMGGILTREEIQEEFDDIVQFGDEDPLTGNPSPRTIQRRNAKASGSKASAKGSAAIDELADRVEARQQWMNESTQGNTTYPVFDRPAYSSEDDWEAFTDVAMSPGKLQEMLNYDSAEKNANGDVMTVQDVIAASGTAINQQTAEIEDINATYVTGADGRPRAAFALSIKGKRADGSEGFTTVLVDPATMAASAPGVVDRFDTNTLDEEILKTAYQVHNNFQGLSRERGTVTVPFNDTFSGGSIDLQITFSATPHSATGSTAESFDLTQGTVKLVGTANGQALDVEVSYAEYQRMMRDYGREAGRTADMQWAASLNPPPNNV